MRSYFPHFRALTAAQPEPSPTETYISKQWAIRSSIDNVRASFLLQDADNFLPMNAPQLAMLAFLEQVKLLCLKSRNIASIVSSVDSNIQF